MWGWFAKAAVMSVSVALWLHFVNVGDGCIICGEWEMQVCEYVVKLWEFDVKHYEFVAAP